jgi:hypothetical protein
MANETFSLYEAARATLPPELINQFSVALALTKILAIFFIAYLIVMIAQAIMHTLAEQKNKKNLARIAENTEETNTKLESLMDYIKNQSIPSKTELQDKKKE